jgi:hypothetical protein
LKKQNLILEISELNARKEADEKLKELENREQKVVSQEKELADRQKHQRTEVNKKVEKKLTEKERELLLSYDRYESNLETKYRILERKYMSGFILSLVYGIVVTLIQMFKSEVFKTELMDFGKAIVNTGVWITHRFTDLIDIIYGMKLTGNEIGDKTISSTLILMLIFLIILSIDFLRKRVKKFIRGIKGIADKSLLEMMLIILMGNMVFCDWIKEILSINLIASIIFECGTVLLIRKNLLL